MLYFIFRTLPNFINSYLLGPLMIFVFGTTSFILPSAVKEHFSESPQRILSFLFIIILLNGTIKFLAKFFSLIDYTEPLKIGKSEMETHQE